MSTKKTAKKTVSAKKTAPAKKSAPVKKSQAKKPAPAKKTPSAKKTVSATKTVTAKKSASSKKQVSAKKTAMVKKTVPSRKPTTAKKQANRKPTAKRPVSPKGPMVETVDSNANSALNFAYSIAEMMKRENRRQEAEASAADKAVRLSRRPTSRSKGKNTQKFPASDLAEFKKRLLQLRQTATGQSATLKTIALEQTDDHGTEDDDGSDAFLRLQSLNQVDSKNKLIFKIDEALRRIAEGTYGICELCGQLIRKPRLMNMPFVHTCMECQSAMESPSGARG